MVATTTTHHFQAKNNVRQVVWQPADAATAQIVDLGQPQGASVLMLPIAHFRNFYARIITSLLVGTGPTAFSICAATDAAGTGVQLVKTHAMGSLPDAEGDTVVLECSAEEIREVLATATHVGVWLDCNNNDDETIVTLIRADALYGYSALDAEYVS
jgi:hypothetical protein